MQKLGSFFLAIACVGCGEATCPPGYPVMRDGECFRAEDGSTPGMDGAVSDSGSADGGGAADDAGGSDAAVTCDSTHPLFDGTGRRWCDPGCYCMANDACYASSVAEACCTGAVVCGPPDGGVAIDAGVQCNGMHPLVRDTEPMRYCAPGNCYCGDPTAEPVLDVCYPAALADACCPVATVCY